MRGTLIALSALLSLSVFVGCEKNGENDGFLTGEKASASEDKIDMTADIGEVEAKRVALKDAGVGEGTVTDYSCTTTVESDAKFYNVSFKSGDSSFEYKLRAADGGIFGANKQTAYY